MWNKVFSAKAVLELIAWLQHTAEHMSFVKASQKLIPTLFLIFQTIELLLMWN